MAKDKRWMQKANRSMKRRGTVGSFTKWCKDHGYGGVTSEAIAAGLRAGGKIAKKAAFAKAARKARHGQGGMVQGGPEEFGLGGILGETAVGAGSGLLTGAAIGAVGGPIGMGLGALIGGGVGLVKGIFGHRQETFDKWNREGEAKRQEDLFAQDEQKAAAAAVKETARVESFQNQYLSRIESNQAVNPFTPTFPFGGLTPFNNQVEIEVEDDEVIFNPKTGKGRQVQGKSHAQGGIITKEEPGTMIFSDKIINKLTGNTFAKDAAPLQKRLTELDKLA